MKPAKALVFPPFRLDPVNGQLWCDNELAPLPPKTFAVLCYFFEHAERFVTKEELFKAVWLDTRISESVLKGYIRDLRETLGDNWFTEGFETRDLQEAEQLLEDLDGDNK